MYTNIRYLRLFCYPSMIHQICHSLNHTHLWGLVAPGFQLPTAGSDQPDTTPTPGELVIVSWDVSRVTFALLGSWVLAPMCTNNIRYSHLFCYPSTIHQICHSLNHTHLWGLIAPGFQLPQWDQIRHNSSDKYEYLTLLKGMSFL